MNDFSSRARFSAFLPQVLKFETEYNADGSVRVERDPDDPGGTTKYGIDQRSHPRVNVAALTYQQAEDIYFEEWTKWPCDEIAAPFGELVFDITVNGGHAVRWLQEGLRAYLDSTIVVDAFAGSKTFAAAAKAAKNPQIARQIVERMCTARENRFRELAKQRRFKKYLRGWIRRSDSMETWALDFIKEAAAQ